MIKEIAEKRDAREMLWILLSSAFAETGPADPKRVHHVVCDAFDSNATLTHVNRIVFWEVCGSFARDMTIAFATLGATMPDWDYEDAYVLRKIKSWRKQPLILSLINPAWWIGYPLAVLHILPLWAQLRLEIRNQSTTT